MARRNVLEWRRRNLGYVVEEIAGGKRGGQRIAGEKMGVPSSYISQILNRWKEMGSEVARRIEDHIDWMDRNWMDEPHPELWGEDLESVTEFPSGTLAVPILDSHEATRPQSAIKAKRDLQYFYFSSDSDFEDLGKSAFMFFVQGHAMTGAVNHRDRVIIDPDTSPDPGDLVLIHPHNMEEAILRWYYPQSDGSLVFEAENPIWPRLTFPPEDDPSWSLCGTVIWQLKRMHTLYNG